MKIAVHILGYNVTSFVEAVLKNASPHVDRIYVAYSRKPFDYIPGVRDRLTNPTDINVFTSGQSVGKIRVIEGDWLVEEDMRNSCLAVAEAEGMDWLLTQDADEFYTDNSWRQIKLALAESPCVDQFKTTWYNFWKTSQYVLMHPNGEIKHTNAGFALRCGDGRKFIDRRITNAVRSVVLDTPCFHYGYVMSDKEMEEKLTTWSHAHQVDRLSWFEDKWLGWTEHSRHLHPVAPAIWNRAIRFPLEQPDFAHQFALPMAKPKRRSRLRRLRECIGDKKIEARSTAIAIRDLIR